MSVWLHLTLPESVSEFLRSLIPWGPRDASSWRGWQDHVCTWNVTHKSQVTKKTFQEMHINVGMTIKP